MLASTITYLRRAIAEHPGYPDLAKQLYHGQTVETCSPRTLKWLAHMLKIPYSDSDNRGRPRKDGQPRKASQQAPDAPEMPSPTELQDMPEGEGEPMDADMTEDEETELEQSASDNEPEGSQGNSAAQQLAKLLEQMTKQKAPLDEKEIVRLIKKHAQGSFAPPQYQIKLPNQAEPKKLDGMVHWKFPLILSALNAGCNVMLIGPAGSGKTTIAEQCAKALDIPFHFTGAVASEYKLSGFIDAQGRIISTEFKKAYCEGGLFLFDEIDGSSAQALLAFNAALANGHADFPDGAHTRHINFKVIAAANTYGTGASRQYVGRNQLDAASLDRFIAIDFDYDETLEKQILGIPLDKPATTVEIKPKDTTADQRKAVHGYILAIRNEIALQNIRHVCSPRASMNYMRLLEAGWPLAHLDEAVIWKGLDKSTVQKIKGTSHYKDHATAMIEKLGA